jgi:hypothetical protein
MSVQCSTCQAIIAVDLKLAVSQPNLSKVSAAPKAEFLIITWTAAEAEAMALVFGNGGPESPLQRETYRVERWEDINRRAEAHARERSQIRRCGGI